MTIKQAISLAPMTAMFFSTWVCNAADLPKCGDPQVFQLVSGDLKQAIKDEYSGLRGHQQFAFNLLAFGKINKNATEGEIEQAAAAMMQKLDNMIVDFRNARVDADSGLVKYCSADARIVNIWTNAVSSVVMKYSIQMTEENNLYVKMIDN